jgi:5,10-methylenetetrahydrofolate reductase
MATVVERRAADPDAVLTICDFSPPRGADPGVLEPAGRIGADYISVAYHPGKSTTANSAFVAHAIEQHHGQPAIFTLATRDMNRLALQSLLLGAALAGLEHVVIVGGDGFTEREQAYVRAVNEAKPSELLRLTRELAEGRDFRGRELAAPAALCVGATIDLGRGATREPALTRRKVEAGAQFFLVQPIFSPNSLFEFLERYEQEYGEPLAAPLFSGLQILTADGIVFGDIPPAITTDLERGRPGDDIALDVASAFLDRGVRSFYVVPPILRGGARDYDTAASLIARLRTGA